MSNEIFTIENIVILVKPISEKYHVDQIEKFSRTMWDMQK